MTSYTYKWTGKKVSVIVPSNNYHSSFGFCMVVNNKTNEIYKFFKGEKPIHAIKYAKYKDLSFIGKLKYWWNYKRG